MTRITIIGAIITACILAGCSDNRSLNSLKSDIQSFSNIIANLDARMAAVEDACLQLNAQLNTLRASDQPSVSKPSTRSQSGEPASLLSVPGSPARLTRSSFSRRVTGMTPGEVITLLGTPDKTSEEAGVQNWTYQRVNLTTENGGEEQSSALIVFEQGCVARGILTEKVQYSSPPKEEEPANTPVNTNAAPATNATPDTNSTPDISSTVNTNSILVP